MCSCTWAAVTLLQCSNAGVTPTSLHQKCEEAVKLLMSHECPSKEAFEAMACLPHDGKSFFHVLNEDNSISTLMEDPVFFMLDLELQEDEQVGTLFANAVFSPQVRRMIVFSHTTNCTVIFPHTQAAAHLLYVIFSAQVKQMFYKLNVHEG